MNEVRPFYQLDEDLQTLIRQRRPKLQSEQGSNFICQQLFDEFLTFAVLLGVVRTSKPRCSLVRAIDSGKWRPMSTIVELSPDQTHPAAELTTIPTSDMQPRENIRPLMKAIAAFRTKQTTDNTDQNTVVTPIRIRASLEKERFAHANQTNVSLSITISSSPSAFYDTTPIRSMADVDAELAQLQW